MTSLSYLSSKGKGVCAEVVERFSECLVKLGVLRIAICHHLSSERHDIYQHFTIRGQGEQALAFASLPCCMACLYVRFQSCLFGSGKCLEGISNCSVAASPGLQHLWPSPPPDICQGKHRTSVIPILANTTTANKVPPRFLDSFPSRPLNSFPLHPTTEQLHARCQLKSQLKFESPGRVLAQRLVEQLVRTWGRWQFMVSRIRNSMSKGNERNRDQESQWSISQPMVQSEWRDDVTLVHGSFFDGCTQD